MTVTLYTTSADSRTIDKNLENETNKNCQLYDAESVLTPTIILDYSDSFFTVGYNYVFIPKFNRYYFVKNSTVDTGDRIILELSCDVLMSYSEDIKQITCTVARQENEKTPYLTDNSYKISVETQTQNYMFQSTPFNHDGAWSQFNYVLAVVGG